MEATDVR